MHAAAASVRAETPPLARDGRSSYTIVVAKEASPSEQYAAAEFQRFVAEISGTSIPIRSDSEPAKPPLVCIGHSRRVADLGTSFTAAGLGQEGFVIRTTARGLLIAGAPERGTLYGVYAFLEDELGCHWFTPDCSRVPKAAEIRLRPIERRFVPKLEYRGTDYPHSRDPVWAARVRLNGNNHATGPERGGNIKYGPFVHTFESLIPPKEQFDAHPEFFSLVKGERLKERSQLCLTNPDVIRLGTDRLRDWMTRMPDATIFSVSQNDWHNYCQCDACAEQAAREESESGNMLAYVNALAADVAADFPGRAVDTLAYQYTRKPPKLVKPLPNVIVRLCSIECCFLHPLATDEFNKSFVADIVGWSKTCDRLYIWDYVIDYSHSIMPFPNLYVLKPNINFFIDHGVKGIYEESCYFTKGGEMGELRAYIIAKTLWDPTYSTDRAIDEIVAAYYGAAGPYVRRYVNLIHKESQKEGEHMRIGATPAQKYLSPQLLNEADALFDQAEQAAQATTTVLHRVQVARLPVLYTRIAQALGPRNDADKLPCEKLNAAIDRFEAIARKEGLSMLREGGPIAPIDPWLKHVRENAAKLP
jgi:hypothetical protein